MDKSTTPLSDAALLGYDAFCGEVRQRLESGKRVYGDSSFERPIEHLITEIQQELMDVTGWSFILFQRLEKLRDKIRAVADATGCGE